MQKRNVHITKASGEQAVFKPEKLTRSLRRAGAKEEVISQILDSVRSQLYDGMTTKKIYQIAFGLLKKASKTIASKYKLKDAIFELGPDGFAFEIFISELLKHQGYDVQLGKIVSGHCVAHEIDVIAAREEHHFMVECKFHHNKGIFCNVKVPLYIQSRFKDVEQKWLQLAGHETKFHQAWVVTNTRFTKDAIQYGTCAGLHLLSWDYPSGNGLREQIDRLRLYPVTCLTSLNLSEKQKLVEHQIILCKLLSKRVNVLAKMGIDDARIPLILKEAESLCIEKKENPEDHRNQLRIKKR